jgi:2'-hydroxyisoflavone reductase
MQILIIGGTRFQGKYLLGELLKGHHHITVFHRGLHALEPHPNILEVLGDRNSIEDLKKIPHKNYDWLVDTCAYLPLQCDQVLSILGQHLRKICFISSAYVYKNLSPDINEDAPLKHTVTTQNLTPENYGSLKIMCEHIYSKHGLENILILRPTCIIGNGDHTGRLAFWLLLSQRLSSLIKLEISINKKISVIDVRDLTAFTSQALSDGLTGMFNLNAHCVSLNEILIIFHKQLLKNERTTIELTKKKLELLGVKKTNLPFLENDQSEDFNFERAQKRGLKIRSLESTLRDFSKQPMPIGLPEMYTNLIKKILE